MNENTEKSGNKGLVVVLFVLCLVIVGLGVGIGMVMTRNEGDDGDYGGVVLNSGETVSVAASNLYYDYVEKFENDPNFVSDDAVKGFEERITETENNNYKITLAVWCAGFIDEYGGGAGEAVEYLKGYESLASGSNIQKDVLLDYYVSLKAYLEESGDTSGAEIYNKKIEKLLAYSIEYVNGENG